MSNAIVGLPNLTEEFPGLLILPLLWREVNVYGIAQYNRREFLGVGVALIL
jgi:hypothetical protein